MRKANKAVPVIFFLFFIVSSAEADEKANKPSVKTVENYIAVFDFEVTTGDAGISRPLADKVIHEFSQSGKYEVIDRGNMNKILKEQRFQMTGCIAQECKVEAGQILGVGKIVSGSVGIVGKTYYLTLLLIDVRTGKVELSAEDECRCEIDELLGSTKRLARKLIGEQIAQTQPAALKPLPVEEAKTDQAKKAKIVQETDPEVKKQEFKTVTKAVDQVAVSSKIVASGGRFEKLDSGVVRDKLTDLDWYAGPDKNMSWDDANSWVSGLKIDGGGWRMPTLKELKSLYQKGVGPRNMTPLLETKGWWIWSGDRELIRSVYYGYVSLNLDDGSTRVDNETYFKRAFAVRSGK
jgi:TolB-like protein